jgi:hypothetical protein
VRRVDAPDVNPLVEDFGGSGERRGFEGAQTTVALEQTLDLAGKRASRQDAASAELKVAAAQAIGGILADGPGLSVAFAVEVAALALAAVLFSRIATDPPAPTGKSVFRDLVEGLRYVRHNRRCWASCCWGRFPACC